MDFGSRTNATRSGGISNVRWILAVHGNQMTYKWTLWWENVFKGGNFFKCFNTQLIAGKIQLQTSERRGQNWQGVSPVLPQTRRAACPPDSGGEGRGHVGDAEGHEVHQSQILHWRGVQVQDQRQEVLIHLKFPRQLWDKFGQNWVWPRPWGCPGEKKTKA